MIFSPKNFDFEEFDNFVEKPILYVGDLFYKL